MANTKSAIKRIRTSAKRHERNQAVKSATRTYVRKARTSIARDAAQANVDVVSAISALDRAATKGVIHPNNAARRKSRLMKALNATTAAATPVETVTETASEVAPEESAPKRGRGRTATAKAKPATPRTRARKTEE